MLNHMVFLAIFTFFDVFARSHDRVTPLCPEQE